MKKRVLALLVIVLLTTSVMLAGCGGEAGTLQFHANGEDFVRQGFVSKDGWSISFDHVYITLADIAAYQTDPPYDPHDGGGISGDVTVSLDGAYTVDLAEGGEDASPILVDELTDIAAGQYNAISWNMVKATTGPALAMSWL